jgi:DNA (cytosine-5)-methyltransferase 1
MSPRKVERTPTVVDLFCGAGGFAEGFRQAGFRCIAANDVDPWAGETFRLNHHEYGTKFILGDIARPEIESALLDAVGKTKVDAVVGGPPCQGFSQVRNHHRIIDDSRNKLYREFVSVVSKLRPRIFVMENVPGLQNIAGGEIRQQILEDLALDGEYAVESRVVDAAAFGVPQTRLRVLFVGVQRGLKVPPPFPVARFDVGQLGLEREHVKPRRGKSGWKYTLRAGNADDGQLVLRLGAESLLHKLLDPADVDLVTVEQAIGDLIDLTPSAKLDRRPSNAAIPYAREAVTGYQRARRAGSLALYNADVPFIREDTVARLDALPQGGNFRDLPEELCGRYLNGTKWGPDLGKPNLSRKYFFAYRKLHPNFFTWTLNTKADCVYHYAVPRALTVREFARLHSFNDTYHFLSGDRHSRYRQVGNAVPPFLGRAVATAVRQALDEVDARRRRTTGSAAVALVG